MLYMRHFSLITDHRPLLDQKICIPVYSANCLQKWAATLLDNNFTIKYNKPDTISHADALSRPMTIQNKVPMDCHYSSISGARNHFSICIHCKSITSHFYNEARVSDPVQQKVMRSHRTKWPEVRTDKRIQPFFQRRASLSVDECLVCWRVIVLSSLQDWVIKQFHYGHKSISHIKGV